MALTQEICFAQAQLDADKAKLAELENCTTEPFNSWKGFGRTPLDRVPELKVLRERIALTQSKIEDLTATQNALLEREFQREQDVERRKKWKESVLICRTLKDEDFRQQLLVLKLRGKRDTCQIKRDQAIASVNNHAANPPSWDEYPTEAELEQYRQAALELEDARVRASAAYGLADAEYQREVIAFTQLRGRFEHAANAEKNLRPGDV